MIQFSALDTSTARLAGALALAFILVFIGLGDIGFFEPDELERVDRAEKLLEREAAPAGGTGVDERLVAFSWSVLGKSELAARLPFAIMAMVSLLALFALTRQLLGFRLASLASLFFVSSPMLLFHGRQLTAGMPPILGETLAFLGLVMTALSEKRSRVFLGAFLAACGLGLGLVSKGALVGVASPLATVALSLILSGNSAVFFRGDGPAERRMGWVTLATLVVALLSAAAYLSAAFLAKSGFDLVLGGAVNPPSYKLTFDFPLEQIAYGWFPWSALAPISALGFFLAPKTDKKMLFARALAMTGILIGYATHGVAMEFTGIGPSAIAAPMALSAALAVSDMASSKKPLRFEAFLGVALFALMTRDFFQNQETVLLGYAFEGLAVPDNKDYLPILKYVLFAVPAGLLIATGFINQGAWRKWQYRILIPLAPAVFGVGVSFFLVPHFSMHFSSKHAIDSYEEFRTGDEPVAVLGKGRFLSDAKRLNNKKEAVEWLSRNERVFALFPPQDLPDLDHEMRKRRGTHLFVLDAKSDRFVVALSKHRPGEKNDNPLLGFTSSKPFEPGPRHTMEVNFDDKLTFLGWDLESDGESDALKKGEEMVFTSYWRVEAKVPASYEIFMHIDGPGGRIHGDHKPFDGEYPTNRWGKGDYIKEVYRKKIPLYQASGDYTIRMGLYNDLGRLPIRDEPSAKENSMLIGSVAVK